jgi:predicted Zn-dependent protease
VSSLFYNLGKRAGPKVRKAKWAWQSITASEADTIKAEHEVGKDLACEIRNQLGLDTELQSGQLLSEVGSHLAVHVTNKLRTFSFEAVKCSEPNAFALPGGFIFVTRSLLELCDWNSDQVAFILAHEMAHVIRGHAMDRIVAGSAIAAGAKAASIRGLLNTWLGNVGVKFLKSAYSQDMELEADTLATRLATAAGYDANGPKQLFSSLKKLDESDKQPDFWNYFSSHPTFEVRINNIDRLQR